MLSEETTGGERSRASVRKDLDSFIVQVLFSFFASPLRGAFCPQTTDGWLVRTFPRLGSQ